MKKILAILFVLTFPVMATAQDYYTFEYRQHTQVVEFTVTAGTTTTVYFPRTLLMPTIQVKPGSGGTAAVTYTCDPDVSTAVSGDWEDSGFGDMSAIKTIWASTAVTGVKLSATTADAVFRVTM